MNAYGRLLSSNTGKLCWNFFYHDCLLFYSYCFLYICLKNINHTYSIMADLNLFAGEIAGVIFKLIYFGAIIGTITVVILDNRNPVKTMAWILILMFLPLVGLVFYFFFGRSTRRERIISKKTYNRLMKKPIAEYLAQENSSYPQTYVRLIELFKETNQALPFEGNRMEIFTEGYAKLQALIQQLYRAKHHIHMEYYIIEDDAVGRLIRDVLIDKAREGVEVRVVYDDVGCWHVPGSFFEEMKNAGIEVRAFLKVRFPLFTSKVNYRNHRKIVVIDGRIGFVGGMNLAERYLRGFAWGEWRDTHIMIEGKAVHGLQTAFLLDWYFVDSTLITSSRYFPRIESCGDSMAQIVTSDPIGPWKEIMQGLVMAISQAQKYFYIQTPYFIPDESLHEMLKIAVLSGVKVKIMIPSKPDHPFVYRATEYFAKDIVEYGAEVYMYQNGFLHSKVMVVDDEIVSVGTANMDVRSFKLNFEINAFIYDRDVAEELIANFDEDQKNCIRATHDYFAKQSKWRKFKQAFSRLLSPIL